MCVCVYVCLHVCVCVCVCLHVCVFMCVLNAYIESLILDLMNLYTFLSVLCLEFPQREAFYL